MTAHTKTRNERGLATVDVLIGSCVASIMLSGLTAFAATSMRAEGTTLTGSDDRSRLSLAHRAFVRDIDTAHALPTVSVSEVLIDAGDTTTRWAVTADGELVSQRAVTGTTDWASVPAKVWVDDVAPDAFEAPVEYQGRLVEITWLTEQAQIDTAVSVRP